MSKLERLLEISRDAIVLAGERRRLALCPDLGGRTFAELDGLDMHRLDLDTVRHPDRPFNNYGGGNFWPAPEGGQYGFNYRGDEWYVQPAINRQPFAAVPLCTSGASACIEKRVALANRAGATVEARMRRELALRPSPTMLRGYAVDCCLSYATADSFEVLARVSTSEALLGSWTLEQFDATSDTVGFCAVENPRTAINFDFYEHPGERIQYAPAGFTYRVDGRRKGQIGVKSAAGARCIGFYDVSRRIVCLRQVPDKGRGMYFNIADNSQPQGPYSAADGYSIFNSAAGDAFFELETIGPARVLGNSLIGSRLVSETTFAILASEEELKRFVSDTIGEWISAGRRSPSG